MYSGLHITAVIPALDEAEAIADVVADLVALHNEAGLAVIDDIIVADNGSIDDTAALAVQAGARVTHQFRRGYGATCLAALATIEEADVVLFVDGDRSVRVNQTFRLLDAIVAGADLVIGSRILGQVEPGAMTWPQRIGNRLVAGLITLIWRTPVSDLGPFRAIRLPALKRLDMQDSAYGWTVEMQVKALQHGLLIREVPVDCLVRIGRSKVSGTVRGVFGAACGMLGTVLMLWWRGQNCQSHAANKPRPFEQA